MAGSALVRAGRLPEARAVRTRLDHRGVPISTCKRASQVSDISLEDYIAVKPKFAVYVPHTAGRYQKKRFRKAQCPIVERYAWPACPSLPPSLYAACYAT